MPTDQQPAPRVTFLVERYLQASAATGLAASVSTVAALCAGSRGPAVRYLLSLYLPSEDTCFCLFDAASPDAVRAVNAAGAFPFDRITRAVLLLPPSP